MWGQLQNLTQTLVDKANELVDEVQLEATAAAEQLVSVSGNIFSA